MAQLKLHIGDLHRITATFRNAALVPTNPTAVVLIALKPDKTRVTLSAVSDGAGVYHCDIPCDQAGTWVPKWFGTGAVTTAEPAEFYVSRDPVGAAA